MKHFHKDNKLFKVFDKDGAQVGDINASTKLAAEQSGVVRSLNEIAADVIRDWKHPYFGAVPYLRAMQTMLTVAEDYGADSGTSIVAYFLSNATSWRGDTARRVKKELNDMLKAQRSAR